LTVPTTTSLSHLKTQLPTHFLGTHSAKVHPMQERINFMKINKVEKRAQEHEFSP